MQSTKVRRKKVVSSARGLGVSLSCFHLACTSSSMKLLRGGTAAAVGDRAGGLEQQQAVVGGGEEQAPAAALLDQGVVIEGGVEAEQRQFEAVLAQGLAVAAAGVAAELGEDRHHLVTEADRP